MEVEEEKISTSVDDDGSSDDETSESETELMVATRARRATAGNRYSILAAQEEVEADEEDEVAMLFAEGEGEDEDFNSDEGDDDADMSSSDDDDQGPNVAVGDLEGEKEIEKEAKIERARKRKADLALTTVSSLRKKPKIDPTSLRRAPAPKPSKRKERVSWLPESDVAPGRTSLRKQTILHRAETHAKLKENEAQRLKLKAKREKREREREAAVPKELTQADRLAEAERVERKNAKSLNRWEAMEKKRAEEQAARLAALKERKLEGAVVTLYSSSAKYYGLKENKEIDNEMPTEVKKRGRKPKALLEQLAAAKLANQQPPALAPKQEPLGTANLAPTNPAESVDASGAASQSVEESPAPSSSESTFIAPTTETALPSRNSKPEVEPGPPDSSGESFLTGIHEYASMSSEKKSKSSPSNSKQTEVNAAGDVQTYPTDASEPQIPNSNSESTINGESSSSTIGATAEKDVAPSEPTEQVEQRVLDHVPLESSASQNAPATDDHMPDADKAVSLTAQLVTQEQDAVPLPNQDGEKDLVIDTQTVSVQPQTSPPINNTGQTSTSIPPPEPPIEVISTRNLIILEKFDDLSDKERYDFGLFYNNRKTAKPVKHSQELCPVTGLPARYRDPSTGIAYANATAYKKLQELRKHQFAWSGMLGCYVGRTSTVARGVPDGFLGS